jgi:hypothetical protein
VFFHIIGPLANEYGNSFQEQSIGQLPKKRGTQYVRAEDGRNVSNRTTIFEANLMSSDTNIQRLQQIRNHKKP